MSTSESMYVSSFALDTLTKHALDSNQELKVSAFNNSFDGPADLMQETSPPQSSSFVRVPSRHCHHPRTVALSLSPMCHHTITLAVIITLSRIRCHLLTLTSPSPSPLSSYPRVLVLALLRRCWCCHPRYFLAECAQQKNFCQSPFTPPLATTDLCLGIQAARYTIFRHQCNGYWSCEQVSVGMTSPSLNPKRKACQSPDAPSFFRYLVTAEFN